MTIEPLIAEDEAARILGLSPRTLQSERVKGVGMPFAKLGRRVLYRPEDLRARIEAHMVRSTTEAQQRDKAAAADEDANQGTTL